MWMALTRRNTPVHRSDNIEKLSLMSSPKPGPLSFPFHETSGCLLLMKSPQTGSKMLCFVSPVEFINWTDTLGSDYAAFNWSKFWWHKAQKNNAKCSILSTSFVTNRLQKFCQISKLENMFLINDHFFQACQRNPILSWSSIEQVINEDKCIWQASYFASKFSEVKSHKR